MANPERLRIEARKAVIWNKTLSPGARFLYGILDDMSGIKGECFPRQAWLSETLGVSPRTIREWLMELAGHVTVIRQPRTAIYLMAWAPRDRRPAATQDSDRRQGATLIGARAPLSSLFTEPKNLSNKQQARELIEQYPHAKDLLGRPSDDLVEGCLALAGDLDRLGAALRAMWIAGKRPAISWAWFKTVLPSYLEREGRRA